MKTTTLRLHVLLLLAMGNCIRALASYSRLMVNALMAKPIESGTTSNTFRPILPSLTTTSNTGEEASGTLNGILDDNKKQIGGIVTDFKKVSSDFTSISDGLNKADLGKTAENLQKTLASVDKIIVDLESGKGTIGKMLKDEAFYNNLSKTSKELELLLQDLRLNPTRYVNVSLFGKKNKPYVAPVNDSIKK